MKRVLVLMVEFPNMPDNQALAPRAANILREYAEDILAGKAGMRAAEQYRANDGTMMKVIHASSEDPMPVLGHDED
jgi:hypothetical protein